MKRQGASGAVEWIRPAIVVGIRTLLALVVVLTQIGCANFKAVSAFANETTGLTATIKAEFSQLDQLCVDLAEIDIVINDDDLPLKDCEGHRASQGRLAGVTVAVLDNYARALGALADDRSFNLSPEIQNVGGKLQNLRDRNGNTLANPKQIGALTKIVDLLADVVTSAQREAAVRRMVAETENLKIIGDLLKSFFVPAADGSGARMRPPYVNLLAIASNSARSAESTLKTGGFQQAEPIRTAELLRQLRASQQAIALRTEGPDRVPVQVAAAIEDWQGVLDQFAVDALKPDPRALYERLTVLRDKTLAAQEAVAALRN